MSAGTPRGIARSGVEVSANRFSAVGEYRLAGRASTAERRSG